MACHRELLWFELPAALASVPGGDPTMKPQDTTKATSDGGASVVSRALKSTRRNPFRVGILIGTIITVAVVLLIAQNGESAQLDWLAFHFRAPLWIMLILTAGAGGVVWELVKAMWRRGRKLRRIRQDALKAAQAADM